MDGDLELGEDVPNGNLRVKEEKERQKIAKAEREWVEEVGKKNWNLKLILNFLKIKNQNLFYKIKIKFTNNFKIIIKFKSIYLLTLKLIILII